jgi:hypothetical protein
MPPRYKTVTQQTLIGEGGVALIARRVNEMGYLWHERRVDHGIDGEIELVGDVPDNVPESRMTARPIPKSSQGNMT